MTYDQGFMESKKELKQKTTIKRKLWPILFFMNYDQRLLSQCTTHQSSVTQNPPGSSLTKRGDYLSHYHHYMVGHVWFSGHGQIGRIWFKQEVQTVRPGTFVLACSKSSSHPEPHRYNFCISTCNSNIEKWIHSFFTSLEKKCSFLVFILVFYWLRYSWGMIQYIILPLFYWINTLGTRNTVELN